MFNGNASVSFKSSKPKAEILKVVEESLEPMGTVSISSSGGITITGSRFSGFSYKPSIEGRVTDRDGRFTVNLVFEAKPDVMGWIIAVCAFPLGLAIFILPNSAKGNMQRKADQSLSEIKFGLDEK